jgi:chromosome segregation ATPase
MELQRDLDREAHAKATWEKLQMRLLSEFNEERRINAELIGKSKVLEDEIAWLMGGHTKEREHLEVDLRNALQELSTLQRKIKSSEDESELKDKELKSYERRTSNLEAEVKELRKEVEELRVVEDE